MAGTICLRNQSRGTRGREQTKWRAPFSKNKGQQCCPVRRSMLWPVGTAPPEKCCQELKAGVGTPQSSTQAGVSAGPAAGKGEPWRGALAVQKAGLQPARGPVMVAKGIAVSAPAGWLSQAPVLMPTCLLPQVPRAVDVPTSPDLEQNRPWAQRMAALLTRPLLSLED